MFMLWHFCSGILRTSPSQASSSTISFGPRIDLPHVENSSVCPTCGGCGCIRAFAAQWGCGCIRAFTALWGVWLHTSFCSTTGVWLHTSFYVLVVVGERVEAFFVSVGMKSLNVAGPLCGLLCFFLATISNSSWVMTVHMVPPNDAGSSVSSSVLTEAPPFLQLLPRCPGLPHLKHGRLFGATCGLLHSRARWS